MNNIVESQSSKYYSGLIDTKEVRMFTSIYRRMQVIAFPKDNIRVKRLLDTYTVPRTVGTL